MAEKSEAVEQKPASVIKVDDQSPDLQLADIRKQLQDLNVEVLNSKEREKTTVGILSELSIRVPMKQAAENFVKSALAKLSEDLGL